jgi:hypothetical protein
VISIKKSEKTKIWHVLLVLGVIAIGLSLEFENINIFFMGMFIEGIGLIMFLIEEGYLKKKNK